MASQAGYQTVMCRLDEDNLGEFTEALAESLCRILSENAGGLNL